jgi:hypothetical protein
MISKQIKTEHGDVSSQAHIQHTDNGQVVVRVLSQLGDAKHSHVVTVGAEDGNDLVATLSETELKNHLQDHLDKIRDRAAGVLAGRAKIQKIAGELS